MPELPEVETLRLQLSQLIIGKTIKSIDILKSKSFVGDAQEVTGEKIKNIRRFAKILVIDLSSNLSLAIHLKMSGQFIFKKQRTNNNEQKVKDADPLLRILPNSHTRVIITFINGDKLFFNDQRIFGWIKVVHDVSKFVDKLGPDPLRELTTERFNTILKSSRKPVKLLLMDQEKIAGVGNIYTNDALFLAKIHPKTPANKLSKSQITKLFDKLLKVLRDGIKWKGASQNHFRDIYGQKGEVQEHFYVYDKEGERCIKCKCKIKRITLGGRGTFFCPACQR